MVACGTMQYQVVLTIRSAHLLPVVLGEEGQRSRLPRHRLPGKGEEARERDEMK